MQIEKTVKLLAAATVLLLTFAQTPAQPTTDENEGSSQTPEQPRSETPTTQPGKTPAEGRDYKPFTPSETISADSAIAFPVDI